MPDRETQSCHAQRKQTAKLIPWTKQIEFAGKAYIPLLVLYIPDRCAADECGSASLLHAVSSIAFFLDFTAAHKAVCKSLVLMFVQDEIGASYARHYISATAELAAPMVLRLPLRIDLTSFLPHGTTVSFSGGTQVFQS